MDRKTKAFAVILIGLLLVVAAEVAYFIAKAGFASTGERRMSLLVVAGVYAVSALTAVLAQYRVRQDTKRLSDLTGVFMLPTGCLAFMLTLVR